jgi:hypothetical protein
MQSAVSSSTRREAPALIAPRFPILNLDERRLTPALGFVFDARWLLPGESIISILWKFARANGLPGHALVRLMGVDIDPYEGVEPIRDAVDLKHLRRMLLLPGKVLRALHSLTPASGDGITRFSGTAGNAHRLVITA